MDSKLRKILTECIRAIETGARDAEGCLQQYPDRAAELRPHLELWSRLDATPKAQPSLAGRQRGEHQLLGALADMEKEQEQRTTRFLTPVLVKGAAVVAGVVLLAGGAAGASAALGGPNVPAEVLSGIGISNASDTGKEHANPNAFEGSDNAGQGSDNASDSGKENANPNAGEGSDNAGQGSDNASDTGKENANPNAGEGSDNAGQGSDNAGQGSDNAGQGSDNAGQGSDNASDTAQNGEANAGQGSDNASDTAQNGEATPEQGMQNVIDEIQTIVAAECPAACTLLGDKVVDALANTQTALNELTKTPPDNQAAMGNLEGAVGDLEAAIGLDPTRDPVLEGLMDQLADSAKLLAVTAIDAAIGGDPVKIVDAQQSVADGDALRAAGAFKDAVAKYKDAVAKAESA